MCRKVAMEEANINHCSGGIFSKKQVPIQELRKTVSDLHFILILNATKFWSFTQSNHGKEQL